MKVRSMYKEREKRITPGLYDSEFYRAYNYEESKYFKINHYPSERKPAYFRWTYEDKKLLSPITYSYNSRYSKVSVLKEESKSYHATNRIRGVAYNEGDSYYEVTNETENRLDKISYKFYNTPEYWWAIAHANNIFDCFNVSRGTKLRIPSFINIINKYCT